MKLPVDTSAIAFLCAMPPEPLVDFETKRPRADENGEPLYSVQLLAMGDGSADLLAVKVPGVPSAAFFLWVVYRLNRSSLNDWNRRPLVGRAARHSRPAPWTT